MDAQTTLDALLYQINYHLERDCDRTATLRGRFNPSDLRKAAQIYSDKGYYVSLIAGGIMVSEYPL